MNIITLDFETFYDRDWSLTKVTTEEYIRSYRFEAIMCGVKVNDEKPYWITGTRDEMKSQLQSLDWANSALLAHNTMFDGAILSFVFDCHPKVLLDTLCMARALHGVEAGGSLKALAERYEIGVKGNEVINAMGKHRLDFSTEELERYAEYCVNDVVLTYDLFQILAAKFPPKELKVIDLTLKMFTEPVLELDALMLEQHMRIVCDKKAKLLAACETEKEMLMSNEKFAGLLRQLQVDPPMKTSPTTGKLTYAFAKSDEEFKELLDHPDLRVQVLVAARLGNKSTLEESRTQRFMGIANRGLMPVPLRYYAAHTGRWGGDDKVNLQNLPSRGQNANKLKKSIKAPEGYVMIDCDSSQIEARVLAWLAGQDDLVEAFAKGEDVYKIMASSIYSKPVEEIESFERFVGKTTILGSGYGMGGDKFHGQLITSGAELDLQECKRIISVYRATYSKIPALWRQAQLCIEAMISGSACTLGREGVIRFDADMKGFELPNGLWQRYDTIRQGTNKEGYPEFSYKTRKGQIKLYGGKLIENICQALARCIIAEQMTMIAKKYRVVLTVHDAIGVIAPVAESKEAQTYVEECMRWIPKWATGLPLNCESGIGESYGDC
jgi:DNA polymerase